MNFNTSQARSQVKSSKCNISRLKSLLSTAPFLPPPLLFPFSSLAARLPNPAVALAGRSPVGPRGAPRALSRSCPPLAWLGRWVVPVHRTLRREERRERRGAEEERRRGEEERRRRGGEQERRGGENREGRRREERGEEERRKEESLGKSWESVRKSKKSFRNSKES